MIVNIIAAILVSLLIVITVCYIIDKKQRKTFLNKVMQQMQLQALDINHKAPVTARQEIIIDAPVDKVWNTLTSVNNWVLWQKSVSSVEIESAPQKNIPFTWVGAGIKYNSVIHMHDEQKNFGWIGTTLGAQAIHNWFLTEQGVTTKVVVEESLEGLLVGIFKSSFRKTLLKGMVESLKELKVACEKAL